MNNNQYRDELHFNGVHVLCELAPMWAGAKRIGDGTSSKCAKAGTVERFHSHDHDGPLACGCGDFNG